MISPVLHLRIRNQNICCQWIGCFVWVNTVLLSGEWLVPCRSCNQSDLCSWSSAVWQPNHCVHKVLHRNSLKQCLAQKQVWCLNVLFTWKKTLNKPQAVFMSFSLSLSLYIYIYIYMCVCVCVCVCHKYSETDICQRNSYKWKSISVD